MKRALSSDLEAEHNSYSSFESSLYLQNNNSKKIMQNYKVFNDCVHGHIEIHPLCVAIIDTPQFQRLRNIKQLSTTYRVYPGACHNRFEHCLGVSHLAGQMVNALVHNTPGLVVTPEEKLSVEIAGLCHDLGHGPFSHTWEMFLRRYDINWKHEHGSEQVLDYLIEENNLKPLFDSYSLNLNLIKELIRGEGTSLSIGKSYLYQIIANKQNDIDVDKWDYFLRDGLQLNLKITFDYHRILSFCTVLTCANGKPYIAFRNKEAANLFDMFRVRADLHKRAYQHVAVKNIELMLIDALVKANDYIDVQVDGKSYKLNEAHTNVKALCKLTDHIQYVIEYSSDTRLAPAQHILHRINTRQLYSLIGAFSIPYDFNINLKDIQSHLNSKFNPLELGVFLRNINFGSTGNPFEKIVLYKKPKSTRIEIDDTLSWDKEFNYFPFHVSKETAHKEVQVFCKSKISSEMTESIQKYVQEFLKL